MTDQAPHIETTFTCRGKDMAILISTVKWLITIADSSGSYLAKHGSHKEEVKRLLKDTVFKDILRDD